MKKVKSSLRYPEYFTEAERNAMDALRVVVKPYNPLYLSIDLPEDLYYTYVVFANEEQAKAADSVIREYNRQVPREALLYVACAAVEGDEHILEIIYEC